MCGKSIQFTFVNVTINFGVFKKEIIHIISFYFTRSCVCMNYLCKKGVTEAVCINIYTYVEINVMKRLVLHAISN